jgi:hypothetical protein
MTKNLKLEECKMSFAATSKARSYRTFVAVTYTFAGLFVTIYSLIYALFGRCDSDVCMPWTNYLVLQFHGPIIAIMHGGIAVYRWAAR